MISRRAEKKHRSEIAVAARRSKFTMIVEEQAGLCWFCNTEMGVDCTREHLLAVCRGGGNERENLRAAHGSCNSAAGHLPVEIKMWLREIGLKFGRQEMIASAHRQRRQQVRDGFRLVRPDFRLGQQGAVLSEGVRIRGKPLIGPQGDVLDKNPVPMPEGTGRSRRRG